MIAALIIVSYVVVGLVVGRQCALRRRRLGTWGQGAYTNNAEGAEADFVACGLAALFWWLALAHFWFARPPKEKKLWTLKREIEKLEKEMGIGG